MLTLPEYIAREIALHGAIPFSRYMQLCLYGAPEEGIAGYYTRGENPFGKAGDFYTSSDVHAVFGRLLARQFREIWQQLGSPARLDLIELGPGRGLFAQDVLDWSEKKFPEFAGPLHYALVEASATLRSRLEERFATRVAAGKVTISDAIEQAAPKGAFVVFANEFFDALPVEVVTQQGELRIGMERGRLVEVFVPPGPEARDYLDRYSVQPQAGERLEVGLAAVEMMRRISAALPPAPGFVIIIDYGYTREEQLAGRHRGTLKVLRRHTMGASPYHAPGQQDITADVNFTALADAASSSGLEPLAVVTQAQFLMGIGEATQFADAFEDCRLPQERAKVALQLKHLATPAGMGESYHVLVLAKGLATERAAAISGLAYGRLSAFLQTGKP